MAHPSTAADQDNLASVPVATWSDGTTVQSVVVSHTEGVDHEYWVIQEGQFLARFASLAAVDAWRAERTEIGALAA